MLCWVVVCLSLVVVVLCRVVVCAVVVCWSPARSSCYVVSCPGGRTVLRECREESVAVVRRWKCDVSGVHLTIFFILKI